MAPSRKYLITIAIAPLFVFAYPSPNEERHSSGLLSAAAACGLVGVRKDLSPAYVGSTQYTNDIFHWSNASTLPALCSVEPDTPKDIQDIFSIIKKTRTPWAVKGGGHCNNNNMSSTYGLQIAMSRFKQIELSQDKKSVKVGMGLEWIEVYEALAPHNLIVVGGRVPDVGVAGLSLSGGYAWHTNEYGFTIDNTLEADVVLPNGTFVTVSENHGSDIFRALQGGVNNFGIITTLTMKTYPTGQVWGGTVKITGDLEPFIDALVEYAGSQKPHDPKAVVSAQFFATNGTATAGAILFYDAPTPPPGQFDAFLSLPNVTRTISTQSFVEFVNFAGSVPGPSNNRATWYSAPIKFTGWTKELIQYILDRTVEYSYKVVANGRSGNFVQANLPSYGPQAYSFDRGSAWPHTDPYNTFNNLFTWTNGRDDKTMFNITVEYNNRIWEKAIQVGSSERLGKVFYPPNYSQTITPVEQIYGPNLDWLRKLKRKVDPDNLIGLTGGFKI